MHTRKHDIRTQYTGEHARLYDKKRQRKPFWKSHMEQIPRLLIGNSVLDIPVGTGRMLDCYRGMRAKGIDISPDMLELAKERGWDDLELGDITDIPVADQSFDSVVCVHMMMHLLPNDAKAAASELKRVARKAIIVDCHIGEPKIPEDSVIVYSREFFNEIFAGWKVTKRFGSDRHPMMRLEPCR